jgi:tetratricopeptide (TPR) repeat protein
MTVNEPLDDPENLVTEYQRLGLAAQMRRELDTAEQWYQRALTIAEQHRYLADMAICYHQLGIVTHARGQLDAADQWHRRGLTIAEQRGDPAGMATSSHHLGIVAQDRGELETADQRLQRARAIREQLGDVPSLAMTYGQLGLLAMQRGDRSAALEWTIRCAALFPSFPHPAMGPAPWNLANLTGELGWDALHAAWQRVTGKPAPAPVIDTIRAIQTSRNRAQGE